ncbi:MAG TPA: hypothetical protein VMM56_13150, partial [Planctomycetaceae bacterium]|nr:hypothetical protein [Planctomycetaceae bacterium]
MTQQAPSIRTCQIIAGALMMGVVMFGAITIAMRLSNEGLGPAEIREAQNEENNQVEQKQSLPGLFFVLICFTGGALIGRFVVLGVLD